MSEHARQTGAVWQFKNLVHRLDSPDLAILVLEHSDPPDFALSVDVEVHVSGERYSASFFTPEQARECLDRNAGEALPGNVLGVPDLVVVGSLSLDGIEQAVRFYVEQGLSRSPFTLLEAED